MQYIDTIPNDEWRKCQSLQKIPQSTMMNTSVVETKATALARILIVEDESIIAFNLQEVLESLDYNVLAIAPAGEQAIQNAAELRPDLVIMDIRIKGKMDGIQAAGQIWEHFQIPVIYLTGHSDKSTVERARLTAPFGYLLKPIKERELYVAIESALERCERERWISTVLTGMGDAVIVVDVQGQIKFLNPIAEALTGWQLNEARERLVTDVFNVINEQTQLPIENPIMTVLQQGITLQMEGNFLLITKSGTSVPIADSIAPLRDNSGTITGAVLVFQDITARRQAEERNRAIERAEHLQQQMTELERLNQLKDDFLSTVSHELRTPIANIKMAIRMLELILDQQGLLSPENNSGSQALGRYMNILRNECEQELHLVNDLLDLQRLNADTYYLEPTTILLPQCIPQVMESFQARAQVRQLELQLDLAPNLPPLVSDQVSLNRILTELLNNACKYTPPTERITVTAKLKEHKNQKLEESLSPLASFLLITICNTGVEIPPEELARIFEPFYRIPKSDRWSQGGTGLGLALVQKLVEQLQGRISVESALRCTKFTVELPVHLTY